MILEYLWCRSLQVHAFTHGTIERRVRLVKSVAEKFFKDVDAQFEDGIEGGWCANRPEDCTVGSWRRGATPSLVGRPPERSSKCWCGSGSQEQHFLTSNHFNTAASSIRLDNTTSTWTPVEIAWLETKCFSTMARTSYGISTLHSVYQILCDPLNPKQRWTERQRGRVGRNDCPHTFACGE